MVLAGVWGMFICPPNLPSTILLSSPSHSPMPPKLLWLCFNEQPLFINGLAKKNSRNVHPNMPHYKLQKVSFQLKKKKYIWHGILQKIYFLLKKGGANLLLSWAVQYWGSRYTFLGHILKVTKSVSWSIAWDYFPGNGIYCDHSWVRIPAWFGFTVCWTLCKECYML